MSTRSMIGYVLADKSIVASYCHSDGYLLGVGATLLQEFNNYDLAQELVNGGNMSSCGVNYYDGKDEAPQEFKNRAAYASAFSKDIFIEYFYLHDGKKWKYHQGGKSFRYKDLETALVLEALRGDL